MKLGKLRYAALFPALCALIAFVLSLLCLFAGSSRGYLEGYDFVTLNTSRIGITLFNTTTPSPTVPSDPLDFWTSILFNTTSTLQNISEIIENDINAAVFNYTDSVAKLVGLHDFYSIHLLSYCEGFFSPAGSARRNVTFCSRRTEIYSINLTTILQRDLDSSAVGGAGLTVADLQVPEELNDAFDELQTSFHALFILFIVVIVLTGVSMLASFAGVVVDGPTFALVNASVACLAATVFVVVGALVTYAGGRAGHIIDKYGSRTDINGKRGDKFLALTWAGVAMALLVYVGWSVECFLGRRKEKKMLKPYTGDQELKDDAVSS